MAIKQKCTTKNGYEFEVEYQTYTLEEIQDLERWHLGCLPLPVFGMTYEFEVV